jgi:hypothetical protein
MTIRIGSHFLDREQPPLSSEEAEIVRQFHDLYYRRWLTSGLGKNVRIRLQRMDHGGIPINTDRTCGRTYSCERRTVGDADFDDRFRR